jgi:hypothetical protein
VQSLLNHDEPGPRSSRSLREQQVGKGSRAIRHNAPKSSGTSPNFLIAIASLKSPVAGLPEIMTIHRLVRNTPLEPEDIERLVAAYEKTLRAFRLVDRDDPLTEMIAKKVIEIYRMGVRDPAQICELTLKAFGDL